MTTDGTCPQRWGEFVLVQPLGSGGMGTVFLALWRAAPHRVCVIKRLNAETLSDPERLQRFRREADISRAISHPAIARTIHAGDFNGEPFIAQEFVEGKTLGQIIAAAADVGRRLEPQAVAHIGEQVARALAYAHGSRIVHRDIAPSNVMVDFDGGVRLIDFGLARRTADRSLTATGDFIGRVAYTAPEVLTGTSANAHTDIYSLGVLLWELLVGRPPVFEELKGQPAPSSRVPASSIPGPFDNTDAVTTAPPTLRVPRDLDLVVVRAIAPDPDNRFPSADAFAEALHALLPDSYDPKKELAAFLASCYDVPRARELLRVEVAEARGLMEPPRQTIQRASPLRVWWKPVAAVVAITGLALGTAALLRPRAGAPTKGAPQEDSHLAAAALAPPTPAVAPPSPELSAAAPLANPLTRAPTPPMSKPVSHAKPASTSARTPALIKRVAVSPSRDPGLLLDRARDSLSDADFEHAALDAKQVIEIGTPRQKSTAHLVLGKILLFRGKKSEASAEFATAVELDPGNSVAADHLATLRRRGAE